MARFLDCHCERKKKSIFLSAGLLPHLLWISALLLAGSELEARSAAETSQHPQQESKIERLASPTIPPVAVPRSKRKDSKYDLDRIGQRNSGTNTTVSNLERDRQVGASLARDIESHVRLVNDPAITEYVNRLGQKIASHSDAQIPFTIKVIESDEINAFVLPGGYLYVNSGLVMASDNEGELAGILAHEIAHVAARHARRIQRRRLIWSVVARCSGPGGFAAQLAGFLFSMKATRDAEREADLLGMEYQYAAGYDPLAFVDFFERLRGREEENHSLIARAFRTHPTTEERIRQAEREISTLLPAKDQYIVDTSEFEETKSQLGVLTAGRHKSADTLPMLRRVGAQDGGSVELQDLP